eukprot:200453-Pelagomonas_calceolata.AAC.8
MHPFRASPSVSRSPVFMTPHYYRHITVTQNKGLDARVLKRRERELELKVWGHSAGLCSSLQPKLDLA